jgi:hypothetical protein
MRIAEMRLIQSLVPIPPLYHENRHILCKQAPYPFQELLKRILLPYIMMGMVFAEGAGGEKKRENALSRPYRYQTTRK